MYYTDYEAVVKLSEDFNGADLRNVCTEAGMSLVSVLCPSSQLLTLSQSHPHTHTPSHSHPLTLTPLTLRLIGLTLTP